MKKLLLILTVCVGVCVVAKWKKSQPIPSLAGRIINGDFEAQSADAREGEAILTNHVPGWDVTGKVALMKKDGNTFIAVPWGSKIKTTFETKSGHYVLSAEMAHMDTRTKMRQGWYRKSFTVEATGSEYWYEFSARLPGSLLFIDDALLLRQCLQVAQDRWVLTPEGLDQNYSYDAKPGQEVSMRTDGMK